MLNCCEEKTVISFSSSDAWGNFLINDSLDDAASILTGILLFAAARIISPTLLPIMSAATIITARQAAAIDAIVFITLIAIFVTGYYQLLRHGAKISVIALYFKQLAFRRRATA
jgi:hypothetical protein